MYYEVFYEDGSKFKGGDINNSRWNEQPLKPITKIIYYLPNKKIQLQGYNAYNHIVERAITLNSKILSIILMLMVKKGNDVLIVSYNLKNNKIDYDVKPFGKEYRNGTVTGWKEGLEGKPKMEII